jgi:hypothetical protein
MTYEEYRDKIKKVKEPRNRRIKNSYYYLDAWKYYVRTTPGQHHIPYNLCCKVIRSINQYMMNTIVEEGSVKLPYGLGELTVVVSTSTPKMKNGKLKVPNKIDWDATLKLWYEDKEAEKNKIVVRRRNSRRLIFYYIKKRHRVNNIMFYNFRFLREYVNKVVKMYSNREFDFYKEVK